MATASELRASFRSLPTAQRDANQGFSIRVWRALSWLERAESMGRSDYEGRFIAAWISFNALYGRLDSKHRPWGDRESWGAFTSTIWRLDDDKRLRRVLFKRQMMVLKLLDTKFLSAQYWEQGDAALRTIKKDVRHAITSYGTLHVFRNLFERLYIMRVQVFHGASTKGSKLNRRVLQSSGGVLLDLLPVMLEIMIVRGVEEDWGLVCFSPT